MFVTAIEKVDQFTRPIHFIARYYGGADIIPATATLFFVNEEGCAVTCRHVAEQLLQADAMYANYLKFKSELRKYERDRAVDVHRKRLEEQYRITSDTPIRLRSNFVNGVSGFKSFTIHLHPTQDLAIIQFREYDTRHYQGYAHFLRDGRQVKQGKYLCRLGYPFPEFTNYRFNQALDDIEWTHEGRINTPSFPVDGIVTRHIGEASGITGIEMSTPGLRGQSGGPLFDRAGVIYGMQSATRHLHLGFDQINREVITDGVRRRVSNYPFMNVGQCVHVDVIKSFLREKDIKFYEADGEVLAPNW
ncbi:trypsin-like peptidase domain-containing protein [Telluribacter sp. SYSU D00476]|uniref:trypsin-like peptidase domain-containing protein n=1 Tax=Telluribacter sp. SYSU D00476 TaxID=2811430 RepID=UPI001FF5EE48|nr:trypsin-like peptidase domain-containing protein [Telluribacter sp. SYSU D00476]